MSRFWFWHNRTTSMPNCASTNQSTVIDVTKTTVSYSSGASILRTHSWLNGLLGLIWLHSLSVFLWDSHIIWESWLYNQTLISTSSFHIFLQNSWNFFTRWSLQVLKATLFKISSKFVFDDIIIIKLRSLEPKGG